MKIKTANQILLSDLTDIEKIGMMKELLVRRTGSSTREVDNCVQDLFKTGRCLVRDHHHERSASHFTFRRLMERLSREHHLDFVKSTGEHMVIPDYKYAVDANNFAVTAWWFGNSERKEENIIQEMIEQLEHKTNLCKKNAQVQKQ